MTSENAQINARAERLDKLDFEELNKTTHGIAARLDRLPIGGWHRKLMVLFGGAVLLDTLDMYIGGGLLAHLLSVGWSDVGLNGWFQTITMVGYFFGALMSGALGDTFGRRKATVINIAIFSIATIVGAFAPDMIFLIIARGFMGLGLGAMLPGVFGSFGEYIPPTKRARYSGFVSLIGNLAPPGGAFLTMVLIPIVGWRPILIGIAVVSLIVGFCFWMFVPESPRWLASKGRFKEADAIVSAAEQGFVKKGKELPPVSLEHVKELAAEEEVVNLPYRALFRKSMIRRTITISVALMAMNLIVYTIATWTPTIFVLRGLDVSQSILITFVMLIGAPVGTLILALTGNMHGRKPGMIVCLIFLAVAGFVWSLQTDIIVIMISGFILCMVTYYYSMLACSIYIGEVFPTELRLRGAGFSNAMGRVVSIISPMIIANILASTAGAEGVYIFVGICMAVFAIIIAIFGVETRNRTLEEINDGVLKETAKK